MHLRPTLTIAGLATMVALTGLVPTAAADHTCVGERALCIQPINSGQGDPATDPYWSRCAGFFYSSERPEWQNLPPPINRFPALYVCYIQAQNSDDPSQTCILVTAQVPTQPQFDVVKTGCD